MARSACVLICSLAISAPAAAGEGVWTPVGGLEPESARVLVDPVNPEVVYALVQRTTDGVGTLWKSTDGGAGWRSIQEDIGEPIEFLAIDPLRSERLFALSAAGLWASEDGGESWKARSLRSATSLFFWQIVPSPVEKGVLFAWASGTSGDAVVYRSTDGARTWQQRGEVGRSRSSIEAMSISPVRKWLEFIDTEALYVSADDGLTWSVRGTFHGAGFSSIVRSAAAPDRLYAKPFLGDVCLARSDNGGATWRRLRGPSLPRDVACNTVAVDPRNPDLVRVVANGLVGDEDVTLLATSRDGGATWSQPQPFPASDVVATVADPDVLFGAGYPALFRSTDGGVRWTASWNGIASGDLRSGLVAFSGEGTGPTLVAVGNGQLVRSADGGATWTVAESRGDHVDLERDGGGELLYALRYTDGRVVRSSDLGQSWEKAAKPRVLLSDLLADPHQPGRVFASVYDYSDYPSKSTIWRSLDAATTLARHSTGLPVNCAHIASVDWCPGPFALTSDPRDTERVLLSFGGVGFFSSSAPVYLSTDGGSRWHLAAHSPRGEVFALAADPATPGAFLAGTATGAIYRSEDSGEHWAALGLGLPVRAPIAQLLHDDRSGAWYAVSGSQGVFRSTDGGRTWSRTGPGLPDLTWPRAVLDPDVADRLLLAVRGLGVWSWSPSASRGP